MSKLTRTALAIDEDLLVQFDKWMASSGYTNRSEAIRDLIRSALNESQWAQPTAQIVAIVSIVYDHSARLLARDLAHKQHDEHHCVMCSQHVHLDSHQCLEVILMQGRAGQLRKLAEGIIATRGVLAGKISIVRANL